jgi:transposase
VAAKVLICKPGDPEAKGLVERFHDYLERAFLPGRVFTSPADFNAQLADWLVRANHRQHRVLGCRPADRVEADKAAMLALPPVGPSVGWRTSTRLPRDHYVRLDGNDYSVQPGCGRAAHRGHRGPGAGPGLVWRHPGRRACPHLG